MAMCMWKLDFIICLLPGLQNKNHENIKHSYLVNINQEFISHNEFERQSARQLEVGKGCEISGRVYNHKSVA